MPEEQTRNLQQSIQSVKVDSAPSWRYYEYVLEPDSTVNAMLETALR